MGRRKRKSAIEHPLCSVCQVSALSSSSSIPRCSCRVSSRNTICDSCFHRHIFTTISKDITNRVICPEQGCNIELRKVVIRAALFAFGHNHLWEDYTLKSNWHGTSEQWIKRFTLKCPGCRAPIEKNGGCDHMICKRCNLHFNWHQAKNPKLNPFGGNPFGGGGSSFPPQFPGSSPQQGFGQYGSGGGFYNGGVPFQGGNAFPGGSPFSPQGFSSPPIGGQFGQGFGFSQPSSGFGFSQPSSGFGFSQPSSGFGFSQPSSGFGFQQPPFAPPLFPGQQSPFGNPDYFGSGSYGRPRSRRSSRHRSKTRRHRSRSNSSSSSSDDHPFRGSPFGSPLNPYANIQPYPNIPPLSPRGASPIIPPRRPVW